MIGIIPREFYTRKFGFEVSGDNIKVFSNKGDIIEVKVYILFLFRAKFDKTRIIVVVTRLQEGIGNIIPCLLRSGP